MKVLFLKSMASYQDRRVTSYLPGKEYDLDDQEAERLAQEGTVRIIAALDPAPVTAEKTASPIKVRRNKAPELMTAKGD